MRIEITEFTEHWNKSIGNNLDLAEYKTGAIMLSLDNLCVTYTKVAQLLKTLEFDGEYPELILHYLYKYLLTEITMGDRDNRSTLELLEHIQYVILDKFNITSRIININKAQELVVDLIKQIQNILQSEITKYIVPNPTSRIGSWDYFYEVNEFDIIIKDQIYSDYTTPRVFNITCKAVIYAKKPTVYTHGT